MWNALGIFRGSVGVMSGSKAETSSLGMFDNLEFKTTDFFVFSLRQPATADEADASSF